MATPLELRLSMGQRQQLEKVRAQHRLPYMRERAAALLKVADGYSGRQVAMNLLLKRRQADTIYKWIKRYQAQGIAGLQNQPGRGRKPAFFPSA
ncbi:helix-turn-helix domain-containing protein [Nostoc sp. B(2019)]|nr:helix-turn-helix domain-containing protein [Nostoc sp. B(2019)]